MSHLILHIETATKICSVAISENGNLIDCIETSSDGYVHGEKLTLFIQELLQRNNLSATQLTAVSFSSGPGSYTGLRIGLSNAKGLCYALSIPLISLSTLEILASSAKNDSNATVIAMLDARRMEVYAQVFDKNTFALSPIDAVVVDENTFEAFEPFLAVGDGIEKLKPIWENRKQILFEEETQLSARSQALLAYNKCIKKEFEDLAYFTPFYLKDFMVGAPKSK